MEQVFFARSKGRVKKILAVYKDGEHYKLQFTVLDRTNPSRAERAQGVKEKRFATLSEEHCLKVTDIICPNDYPLPELVSEFIKSLSGENHDL